MYEAITYEIILQRMLDRVSNTIDKREGSIIYDALAPAAAELQIMYLQLDGILNETFADTASRDYLIKRAAERGTIPNAATNAILKGVFNIDIPLQSRFTLDPLNYVVTERISAGVYGMTCETVGVIGNQKFGKLIPIDYIEGLTSAELTELLIPGEDEEDTEVFRARYFVGLNSQAFGGNIADYKERTISLAGVGDVKVYPTWNGGGTVKLVIIDSAFNLPTAELIAFVQTEIDPVQNQGEGLGIAPIGHVVTVEGVTQTTVNISTVIAFQSGWAWADVEPYARVIIDTYFDELSLSWGENANLIVRTSQIELRLLNAPGVIDISNTTINTLSQNLVLGENSIPIRGALNG